MRVTPGRLTLPLAIMILAGNLPAEPNAGPGPAASAARAQPYTQSVPGTDVTFEMVPVPGGTFRVGSPAGEPGRKKDEGPRVEVEVEPFHMGRHEVTWAEFDAFARNYHRLAMDPRGPPAIPADKRADAVTYPTPVYEIEAGPVLDAMGRGGRFPAASISQFDARQYTKWLSRKTGRFYRLPTEAEWEYACRAGTTTAYSFGDDPDTLEDYAWYFDNSEKDNGESAYREVGQKKPNPWGLYDMHGNVGEWTIDQYEPDWYRKLSARGKVTAAEAINWPTKKHPRVIRGGGFESEAAECRSAARFRSSKAEVDMHNIFDIPGESPHWSTSGFWIGFRVVSPAKEPPESEKLRFWNADDPVTIDAIRRGREIHELVAPPAFPTEPAEK